MRFKGGGYATARLVEDWSFLTDALYASGGELGTKVRNNQTRAINSAFFGIYWMTIKTIF